MTQLAIPPSAEARRLHLAPPGQTASDFEELARDLLPGVLGIEFDSVESGHVSSRLTVERRHMAPNGFLHAASVIALADSSCGYGCQVSLPAGASGFTTAGAPRCGTQKWPMNPAARWPCSAAPRWCSTRMPPDEARHALGRRAAAA